jgi:undecaprenyl-diphosphatase
MDVTTAVLLGIIQGLTEFLPVSSSGHLVIFQNLFGLTEPELYYDVSVHLGTLLAVVIFYRSRLLAMLRAGLEAVTGGTLKAAGSKDPQSLQFLWMVLIASIPTAIIGLAIKSHADSIFGSLRLVGVCLIVTGSLLLLTGIVGRRRDGHDSAQSGRSAPRLSDALLLGIAQGLAILPGISRSGTTISVGLFLGLDRSAAAAFSFILSISAILGAALLVLKDAVHDSAFDPMPCLIGIAVSFVVGYLSLRFLVFIVNKGHLNYFTPYCWLLGLFALWH